MVNGVNSPLPESPGLVVHYVNGNSDIFTFETVAEAKAARETLALKINSEDEEHYARRARIDHAMSRQP